MSSPQSRGARHRSAMAKQRAGGFAVPLNFLLGGSDSELDSYELARLADVANLRSELHEVLDRLIDSNSQAALARWFRTIDRAALKQALETEESPIEWANRMIRGGGDIVPRTSLPPGAAHLAASLRYQQRNIIEGKCKLCPKPLARNSVGFCEKHLAMARAREQQKKGLSNPGSREYLYSGEVSESGHGRRPSSLAALEMGREKRTRAVLAELGIAPESAAVSLKAAKEAILSCLPDLRTDALTQAQLFEKAMIPTKATGQNALKELLSTDRIERIGKGGKADPYLYFVGATPAVKRAKKPKRESGTKKNSLLLQRLRGEVPGQSDDSAQRELASQHAIENAGRHLRGPR